MRLPQSTDQIQWDFVLENEFSKPRQVGYTFVIDVLNNKANLALYNIRPHFSHSATLAEQPPQDVLIQALNEQNVSLEETDGLYSINNKIRTWIENNFFKNKSSAAN